MTNTIPNVPRDWFDRVHALLYKVAYENTPEGLEAECLGSFIPDILSAPSPAGVDGWDVAGDILEKLSDAQAIIDGLRGEVERLQMQLAACGVVALADHLAQRIGELEGLLNRVKVSLSLDDTEWGYSAPEKYKLLADIRAALSAGKEGDQ